MKYPSSTVLLWHHATAAPSPDQSLLVLYYLFLIGLISTDTAEIMESPGKIAAPSPSQHRRLAPQRKKSVAVDSFSTGDSSSYSLPVPVTVPAAAAEKDALLTIVAIDTSTYQEDADDRYDCSRDNNWVDGLDEDFPMVADWTTKFNTNSEAKKLQSHEEEEEEGKDDQYNCDLEDEGADVEYGFELESSSSHSTSNDEFSGDNHHDESENNDNHLGNTFQIITEEHISLNPPPPTSPYVLVNLESLSGCQVKDRVEKQVLLNQLMAALLGSSTRMEENCGDSETDTNDSEKDDELRNKNSRNNVLGDGLSLDFDEGVIDLFGSGSASHADSSYPIVITCTTEAEGEAVANIASTGCNTVEAKVVTPYAVVPYPDFLAEKTQCQQEQVTNMAMIDPPKILRSTLRLWKLLHTVPTQHAKISPLLSRIFAHLRNSSRSLLWKASMHHEISLLAKEEYILHTKRMQVQEYNDWKENIRGERLQKLYEVRETFLVQVEVAKKTHDSLAQDREKRVERELRRRGLVDSELNNSQLFLHTNKRFPGDKQERIDDDKVFDVDPCYYGDDGWGGTVHEDEIIGEENMGISMTLGEDEVENDEWSPLNLTVNPLGMNVTVNGLVANSATEKKIDGREDIIGVANKKGLVPKPISCSSSKLEPISHDDNLQRKSIRLQKRREEQYLHSSNSILQRRDFLRRERNSIRESLKTTDERIAEATLLKLEERLQNVDDLIEKLQEEEWADEEEEDIDYDAVQSDRNNVGEKNEENEDRGDERSSLLDNILAMILGALPKEINSAGDTTVTEDIFYRYIKDEHDSIVQEWINVFGRLPPFPSPEQNPEIETTIETVLGESNRLLFDGLKLSEDNSVSDEDEEIVAKITAVWDF